MAPSGMEENTKLGVVEARLKFYTKLIDCWKGPLVNFNMEGGVSLPYTTLLILLLFVMIATVLMPICCLCWLTSILWGACKKWKPLHEQFTTVQRVIIVVLALMSGGFSYSYFYIVPFTEAPWDIKCIPMFAAMGLAYRLAVQDFMVLCTFKVIEKTLQHKLKERSESDLLHDFHADGLDQFLRKRQGKAWEKFSKDFDYKFASTFVNKECSNDQSIEAEFMRVALIFKKKYILQVSGSTVAGIVIASLIKPINEKSSDLWIIFLTVGLPSWIFILSSICKSFEVLDHHKTKWALVLYYSGTELNQHIMKSMFSHEFRGMDLELRDKQIGDDIRKFSQSELDIQDPHERLSQGKPNEHRLNVINFTVARKFFMLENCVIRVMTETQLAGCLLTIVAAAMYCALFRYSSSAEAEVTTSWALLISFMLMALSWTLVGKVARVNHIIRTSTITVIRGWQQQVSLQKWHVMETEKSQEYHVQYALFSKQYDDLLNFLEGSEKPMSFMSIALTSSLQKKVIAIAVPLFFDRCLNLFYKSDFIEQIEHNLGKLWTTIRTLH